MGGPRVEGEDRAVGGPRVEGEDRAVGRPRVEGEDRAVGGPRVEGEDRAVAGPRVEGEDRAVGGPRVEGEDRAVGGPRVEGEDRAVAGPRVEGEDSRGWAQSRGRGQSRGWAQSRGRGQSRGRAQSRGRGQSRGRTQSRGQDQHGSGRSCGGGVETPAGGEEDQWSSSLSDIIVKPFEEDTGPTVAISADLTELFLSLFTPQLMEHIVVETNRFASLCLSATHRGDGPVPTWETSVDELKAYFGFQILMGFNRLPEIREYWSTNSYFHYFPIASRISRNRFLEVQRFLHFVDNITIASRGEPEYDRLAKVRPVIKSLQRSFFESYKPHRENAINEAMMKFKGRSSVSAEETGEAWF